MQSCSCKQVKLKGSYPEGAWMWAQIHQLWLAWGGQNLSANKINCIPWIFYNFRTIVQQEVKYCKTLWVLYKSIFSHFMVPVDHSSSISPVSYLSCDKVSNGSCIVKSNRRSWMGLIAPMHLGQSFLLARKFATNSPFPVPTICAHVCVSYLLWNETDPEGAWIWAQIYQQWWTDDNATEQLEKCLSELLSVL